MMQQSAYQLWDWGSNHPLPSPMDYVSVVKAINFTATSKSNRLRLNSTLDSIYISDKGLRNEVTHTEANAHTGANSFHLAPGSADAH